MENNVGKIRSWCVREWNKNLGFFGVVLFLIVVSGLVAVIMYITEKYTENSVKFIINLLQILFSWPTLGTIAFFTFVIKFKESIEIFLSNHSPKIPGTDERQKEQKTGGEISSDNSDKSNEIKELEEKIKKSNEETNQTKEQLKNQQALLEIYEFSYLSLFFVDTTKRALKWFFDSKNKATITYDSFDKVWQLIITDPGQRAIIFNVLQQNGMIGSVADGSFSITNKGEEFLKFIGFNK